MSTFIIRVQKSDNFTVISNVMLRDSRLSFGARGLLGYLLSRPNDWVVNVEDLISQSDAGRDAVYRMLKELETCKYLKRERKAGEGGRFRWEITVYELPYNSSALSEPSTALPYTENPEVGQITRKPANQPSTGKPDTVKPSTDSPYTAKPDGTKERFNEETINETHTHFAGARESPFQRGSPPEPIVPDGANPDELPPSVDHFALWAHWEIYHLGLNLDTQQRVAAAVNDPEIWQQALVFWVDNDYRGKSIGKIVKKYRELEAEKAARCNDGGENGSHRRARPAGGRQTYNERNNDALRELYQLE